MPHNQAVVTAICDSVAHNFGTCTCTPHRTCAGCSFLGEHDGVASRADVLAFYRWNRRRFMLGEGHIVADASMPERPKPSAPTLPW